MSNEFQIEKVTNGYVVTYTSGFREVKKVMTRFKDLVEFLAMECNEIDAWKIMTKKKK